MKQISIYRTHEIINLDKKISRRYINLYYKIIEMKLLGWKKT